MKQAKKALYALLTASCVLSAPAVNAKHSWSDYHWARTTSSFNLTIINSTTADWDDYVRLAVSDWSASSKLNMSQTEGATDSKERRRCNGGAGTVRICNLAYGNTGWLGIAGISIDSNNHITTGYTKLNDSYYGAGSSYNTPAWRQSVTCQELGHNVGLGHQDEDFNNTTLSSCMDYQNPPFEYPNEHDYDQLLLIYGHEDGYNSYADAGGGGGGGGGGCNAPPGKGCNAAGPSGAIGWGASLGRRGNAETFIRIDADGTMHLTYVTWAIGY